MADGKKPRKLTPEGRPSLRRELPPDDPIYQAGFVAGGKRLVGSRISTSQEQFLRALEQDVADGMEAQFKKKS
jgi:hypothetical protein